MKIIFPFLILFLITSCKKEKLNPIRSKTFSIESNYTGANYSIKVALPENFDSSTQSYATLYVLDGDQNFENVTRQCEKISSSYSTSNVLVVSIGYGNDRANDYTPTKTKQGEGGAENFMLFIKNQLIPKMENDFGSDTLRNNRVILGHSFGGLLAAYAFTNFNEVFGNYLMLSPSLWYDNEIILKFEQEYREKNESENQLVFMGLGGLESGGRMMAPFQAFYLRLNNNYSSMKLTKNIEPQLEHMGSKNPNIIKGLNYYFQYR